MTIFPDSGATICFGGLKHLLNMGLTTNNLIPSRKVVRAVGGFTLVCQDWLPVEFIVQGRTTKQALYICKKIQRLYFSKAACIDVGILPKDFPNPTTTKLPQTAKQYMPSTSTHKNQMRAPNTAKSRNNFRRTPKNSLFPQQNKTLIGSRIGYLINSPKWRSKTMVNSHHCLAPLLIYTSKKEQSPKPDITQFLCLFTSKNP